MSKTEFALGLGALIVAFLIGAVSGAIGSAVTALAVSGGLYLLGFVSMATAKAIGLWLVAGGALLGGLWWSIVALAGAVGA